MSTTLYTIDDINNDITNQMTNSSGNGIVDQFVGQINGPQYLPPTSNSTVYNTTNYGNTDLISLLTGTLIPANLNSLQTQTNAELIANGQLQNVINNMINDYNSVITDVNNYLTDYLNTGISNVSEKSWGYASVPPHKVRDAKNAITNGIAILRNNIPNMIQTLVIKFNPVCAIFNPVTIGEQLGSIYSTANSSCATAIQLAGQAGNVAGGTNADLVGYDDLVADWLEVNNQWLTVQNEQIGTSLSENPDYTAINTNLTNINNVCSAASAAYQTYITQEMSAAMAPAPFQRPPDTGVTSIINDTIKQYYETEMAYLQGLEAQLQGILEYLMALNIPNIDSTANSTTGSKTVLNLNVENVAFSAPTNPPTGIITIEGNPGQQTINMVLSNGMTGVPGIKGPVGNNGANGAPGKEGQMGQPGIFEIPYQYFKSF